MADGDATYLLDDGTIVYDLTTITGDTDEFINGGFFTIEQPGGSSGTGLIQSFVRLQATGSEDGYNTSLRPINGAYELNTSLSFTHDLRLGDVPKVEIGGVLYYEFLLDINQTNNQPLLSLDKLQVYTSATDRSDLVTSASFQDNTELIYDLDGAEEDRSILLDYSLQSGSGASDLFFYVPVTDFNGAGPETFVILYSSFGELGTLDAADTDETGNLDAALFGNYATNDGFEEWAVSKESDGVGITGFKWEDTDGNGAWDEGELALSGWRFDYSYTYGNGANAVLVEGSAITNADGQYFIPVASDNQNYTITITEFVQDGWSVTYDSDATVDGITTVVIEKNLSNLPTGDFGITEKLNFGNFADFSVSGTKFIDVNGDGDLDPEDTGTLGNVRIFVDLNENGEYDAGIDATTLTASDGTWTIDGLGVEANGKFVYEVEPDGYVQTLGPLAALAAESGEALTGFDFANFELFDISGTKYTDVDGDGVIDPEDTGLADVTIYIERDGIAGLTAGDESTTTDANGNWAFTDLDWTYAGQQVFEVLPNDYVQTLGAVGYTITGTSGTDQADLDFANFELFDISGTKYTDVDGDGVIDPEDTGLVNVTIYIERDGIAGLTAGDESTTTDANGNWAFTDLDWTYAGQQVFEVLPNGYVQTLGAVGYTITGTSGTDQADLDFANFELFDISGYKWEDTDGSATWDDGEAGKADWTIYLDRDADGDGVYETTISQITDADGYYEFLDLGPGSYRVREDQSDTDWTVTSDGVVEFDGESGEDRGGVEGAEGDFNFGNFQLFDISGTKYTDVDGDGVIDPEDTGLGGVTIFIDVNGDGEDNDDYSTTTADDGSWSFDDLDYTVAGASVLEITPDDYVQTLGAVGYTITGTSGTDQADLDFANFELFDISGYKWEDTDGSATWDDGEAGIAGWTIYLDYDSDGDGVIDTTTSTQTDENGYYEFLDLGPGPYEVYEDESDMSWSITSDDRVEFDGASGEDRGGVEGAEGDFNFGNFQDMTISGYKWADANGNGLWDESDGATLAGWTIVLDNDADATNGNLGTAVTDANGYYEFTIDYDDIDQFAPGSLYVYEIQQDGFTQTSGMDFSFAIESGLTIAGVLGEEGDGNFGNQMMGGANRTPGFWQSTLGQSFYDGNPNNQGDANGPKKGGAEGKDFEAEGWSEEDLLVLYGKNIDGDPENDVFEIWNDGVNVIQLTPAQLLSWVSGGPKGGGRDYLQILERDLGAAYLNSINNDAIGDSPGGDWAIDPSIAAYYEDAVAFILDYDPDFNGVANASKSAQQGDWNLYGSEAHNVLGGFNESGDGMVEGAMMQVLMDGDDFASPLVKGYIATVNELEAEMAALSVSPSQDELAIYSSALTIA